MSVLLPNWEMVIPEGETVAIPLEKTHWRNVVEAAFEETVEIFMGKSFWTVHLPKFLAKYNAKYVDNIGVNKEWPNNDSALEFENENDMIIFLLRFS